LIERGNMKELTFENVYGYQEVKNELNLIKSWYEDESVINDPNVALPKGILLYGEPGVGKTLFVREFINNFDCPKYVIEGRNANAPLEIQGVFEKAKNDKFAIVVIDELELLVPKDSKEQRTLQQELDGIDQKGSILVLATANEMRGIGDPLKRPGRFDKKIEISTPDRKSRAEILKGVFSNLDVDVSHINFDFVSKHCQGASGAELKAIVNDVYLRCKNKVVTEEDIETSYERVRHNDIGKVPVTINNYRVAVHEGGHALLASIFKDNWAFYRTKFTSSGGTTETEEVIEKYMTLEKREQQIMIALGGYVAEKMIFGNHDYGSYSDIEKAHDFCRRLLERSAIKGLGYHITEAENSNQWHLETPRKRASIERKTYSLLRKYERKTIKYLKPHIDSLKRFADLMCQQGYVSYRDVESKVMGLGL